MRSLRIPPLWWLFGLAFGWAYLINPEGRYFPAAAPMELLRMEPTSAERPKQFEAAKGRADLRDNTAFWLRSARLRPECSFNSVEWYLGERHGKRVPISVALGPPILREDGEFEAGPWIANVRVGSFLNTHADVYHQCSIFGIPLPWLTRTPFWN